MGDYTVYCHTNKLNGKKYIGITMQKTNQRWRNGQGYRHTHFSYAIKKYGWDNFEHEILFENLTLEEAKQKEIYLIALYKTTNKKYGYNVSSGGDFGNAEFMPNRKEVCMYSLEGQFVKAFRSLSDGARYVHGNSASIGKAANKGNSLAYGYLWRIGQPQLFVEPYYPYVYPKKLRTPKKKGRPTKKLYQYAEDGTFIREYESYTQAMNDLGSFGVVEGRLSHGYLWSYEKHDSITPYQPYDFFQEEHKSVRIYDSEGNLVGDFRSHNQAVKRFGMGIIKILTGEQKHWHGMRCEHD